MLVEKSCKNCDVRRFSCFNKLEPSDISYLNSIKNSALYRKGQNIFNEGTIPAGIYCLNTGKVKINKIGIDGKEHIVRFVTPGGLLGIRALISGREYTASAITLEDSVVCFIEKRAFLKLTVKYPYLSHELMITLSHLLEEAENKITSLAQKGVRERLAETLIALSNIFQTEDSVSKKYVISLSRNDLANIVGTATETVIRLLSEFKDEKLIVINGRKIILKDLERLKKVGKLFH